VVLSVADPGLGVLRTARLTVTGAGLHLVSQTCQAVPGHGTCAVTVRFAPTVVGAVTGGVTLTTNTAQGSVRLPIAARGTRS
jgi:hypothetical protein